MTGSRPAVNRLLPNQVEPQVHWMLEYLATKDRNGLLRVAYWACGNGGEIWVRISNDLIVMGAAWTTAATVHQLREAVSEKYGSYRLVRKLGEGGFGEVWEARVINCYSDQPRSN